MSSNDVLLSSLRDSKGGAFSRDVGSARASLSLSLSLSLVDPNDDDVNDDDALYIKRFFFFFFFFVKFEREKTKRFLLSGMCLGHWI